MADEPESPVAAAIERAVSASLAPALDAPTRALMQVTNPAGEFTAGALLYGVQAGETEALIERARIALIRSTAVISPSALHDELARESPRKVVVDGHMALMRAAGIAADSVPMTAKERRAMLASDLATASETNEQIKARIAERMRAMREADTKTDRK